MCVWFHQGLQPFLVFGHGKSIHRMGLDGKNHRRLVAGVGSSILLDFHFREERLYWAERRRGIIYKASVKGARRQVIMQLLQSWVELSSCSSV